jgi:biofilm PGA synthesis N-glycosyltransferase PgaC
MNHTPLPGSREDDASAARREARVREAQRAQERRWPAWRRDIDNIDEAHPHRPYVPVRVKYALCLLMSTAWLALSVWLSLKWLGDLSAIFGRPLAIFAICFIAWVPGYMNAFLIASICLDRRPARKPLITYPGVTVLVACYNEQEAIGQTIESLATQDYPGPLQILILDDGSTDASVTHARATIAACDPPPRFDFTIVEGGTNAGKAAVLNNGLALAKHALVATVDGDSWVFEDGIRHLVERYVDDPPGTRAVAGSVLVRNSRDTWITRAQEWDYFHGIAAVKRMQSLFHGTLVAQGAFSIYDRAELRAVGGWPDVVGEDIVMTWALLERGWRVGYCEDALVFTSVPDTLVQFARQRKRWSRGMLEAFRVHWRLLFKARMSTLFVWWNLLFLPLDLAFTFIFVPGIVLALFGYPFVASVLTLLVLPLAALWNGVIYRVQKKMFRRQDLEVRRNLSGFVIYCLAYSLIMQPVCVAGYAAELLGLAKRWDTK